MTGNRMQATARSPLEFVACSRCHAAYSSTLPFFLTDCAHTLCQACTANATQSVPPSGPTEGENGLGEVTVCPACGHAGPVVQLDLASSLQHCFRPLPDLIGELGMAAEWQVVNLVDQLAYFREKCAEQKRMLAKAATELKKMRDLKEYASTLSSRSPSVSSATPLAPTRLSLTPAEQKQTAARLSAQTSVQNRAQQLQNHSEFFSASSRASSRAAGSAPRQAEETSKDRLARFAYNPSRASNRSAAATPALPDGPHGQADGSEDESPFYYNVPSTSAKGYTAQQEQQQQQYAYGSHRDSFAAPTGFDDQLEFQDDQQLMPPPPLPTRRHGQQQIIANSAAQTGAAGFRQPLSASRAQQQSAAAYQQAGASISRPATTLANPLPTPRATSTSTSHRQPFRPASVAARPSGDVSSNLVAGFQGGQNGWSGGGRAF
ncbi:hypothetical protein JCM10908_000867 [Rhodotorula pacifica]|uniref:SUMO ligase CST9 n=1 Tax=Rhodotorula pacifica TaxID=1495444 RepID=UPI00316C3DEF